MAPEAMEDNRIDEKCDVYSYGIVMWEVLYQAVPWADLVAVQVMYKVVWENERPSLHDAGRWPMPADYKNLMQQVKI